MASYICAQKDYKPIIVITTIKSFFLDRYANLYDRIAFDKLLIVDEAHNLRIAFPLIWIINIHTN